MTLGELMATLERAKVDIAKIADPLNVEVFVDVDDGENHGIEYLSWDHELAEDGSVAVWINAYPPSVEDC